MAHLLPIAWDICYAGEPFAKFAVEHDILLAKVMFRL